MACNARGSSGRTHTSNQHASRINDNSINNSEMNNIEAQPQEDTMRLEKLGQSGIGRHAVLPKEATGGVEVKEGTIQKSSSYSRSRLTAHRQRSRSACAPSTSSRPAPNNKSSMRVPICMIRHASNKSQITDLLNTNINQPPVTIATLKELDLHSIQNNLNLRIDICHDPELFFQPISGRKGDEKRTEARRYWLALIRELQIYLHNCQAECYECQQHSPTAEIRFRPRLPALFDNLREIVQMLVPESDHEEVVDHLDTDLLVQQVQVGILDAVGLSEWLTGLLTSHCAPIRDASAAAVTEQIRIGTEISDMAVFVDGLEKLFGLLEGMKLDIANHQIRSFRYPLIEGTVEFQQDCFSRAIEAGQVDIKKSQQWYKMECLGHKLQCTHQDRRAGVEHFAGFIHGLTRVCNPCTRQVPATLHYDHQRIMRLQEDIQDHIQISLCLAVFNQQVQDLVGSHCDPTTLHEDLKQRIIALTEDEDGNGGAISDHLDAIGMEITRAAFSLHSRGRKSCRLIDEFDFARTIKMLRDVFREEDEQQVVTMNHLTFLEGRVMHFAKQFKSMTELEISHAQRTWAQARTGKDILLAEWDEMARKLAHIGIIHWRVWEELCYVTETDSINDDEQDSPIFIEHRQEDIPGNTSGRAFLTPSTSGDTHHIPEKSLEQETAAMQQVHTQIQRYDSGFAEFMEKDGDLALSDCEADIDFDRELADGNGYSPNGSRKNAPERRLSRFR